MFGIKDDVQNIHTDSEAHMLFISSSPCSIAETTAENELYSDWSENLHSAPMLENASSCLDTNNASSLEEQVFKRPRIELREAPTMDEQFCCAEKPVFETSIQGAQKDNQIGSIHDESIVQDVNQAWRTRRHSQVLKIHNIATISRITSYTIQL